MKLTLRIQCVCDSPKPVSLKVIQNWFWIHQYDDDSTDLRAQREGVTDVLTYIDMCSRLRWQKQNYQNWYFAMKQRYKHFISIVIVFVYTERISKHVDR